MATRKFHHHHDQRSKFLNYLGGGGGGGDPRINRADSDGFEMNESDLWNTGVDDLQPQNTISRRSKFPLKTHQQRKVPVTAVGAAKSLPVNVPDWSKILRDEYKVHGRRDNGHDHDVGFDDDDEDDDDNYEKLPPHEYLARTRIASFSVHEGVGRTLKGRDLSRVRNAIWKQTGFEQD
ncbi:hypothetical protein OSB04_026741 [Centaurea solstitialis]|uniref:Senescence regulator n=1 Tax=Centaurea solstitialis TaxID=347529 RepID=A0AA38SQ00_9ASTR|nr:hypothetical protein OSB04_026741 [Centaurea solstitialis]